eukprot:evm.model.scf_987EXC.1 EVM.evm.TU.scf_987EXC.1   scf_987EXC:4289-7430(+)
MGLPAPEYRYAVVQRQVKHEDVFFVLDGLRRCGVDGEADHDWRVFGVADGHGGQHCAEFVKQNLGPTLSRLLPAAARMPSLDTPEGEVFAEAVRRALVEAFTSLHADFEFEGCRASGDGDQCVAVCVTMFVMCLVVLPRSGVRLILASDGLWDHLSGVKACKYSRASMLRQAPKRLLSLATSIAGRLSDDTTILTVDILPQNSYDFSDTGDSITRLVVSGVRNLVRKTVVKGRRLLSGSKHGYSYYADVDGLVEYPEVLQTDVSSGSSTPSKSPTPPSSPVTAGSIPVAKEVSGELSKTSSEAWDICSSPWNYNFVGMDPCMSNSPRQNDLAGENWKIMDSAQFYADDTFGNPSKKGPLGQCLLGLAIEEGDSNNSAGEMFEPLHVGT